VCEAGVGLVATMNLTLSSWQIHRGHFVEFLHNAGFTPATSIPGVCGDRGFGHRTHHKEYDVCGTRVLNLIWFFDEIDPPNCRRTFGQTG
jgi:hypothetical protein